MRRSLCVFFAVMLLFGFVGCSKSTAKSVEELLDLGERYLLELDYEQAIVQFTKVIEIEPKEPRGYIGAAKAYIGLGEPEKARAVLEEGMAAVDAEDVALLEETMQVVEEAIAEMGPLAVRDEGSLDLLGKAPGDLGSYDEKTQGDSGNMFRYGSIFVAFDRDNNGEPDGFAYMIVTSLSDLVGSRPGNTVTVEALDELFGQTGGGSGTLNYNYNGVSVSLENVPADGVLPLDHTVVLSVTPRPPEPAQETTTQTPTVRETAPSPAPTETPAPVNNFEDLAPVPPMPEPVVEEYVEEEVEIPVLR